MSAVQIEQIRYELTWRIRRDAMYPAADLDTVKLENDADGLHFGLYAEDQLTTVVSLFDEEEVYQFRKFATIPKAQGKGYGTQLLTHIINYTKQREAKKIWCNARLSATGFYSKFGFTLKGKSFSKNDIDFVMMELQLDNKLAP
jgi:predicted GNAT family N-acyltransferase